MAMESLLQAENETRGAKFGEYFGCALPRFYGDPESEYRTARESAALIDTNYHAILTLTGADRVRYLNAMVTNKIAGLPAGMGTIALLLTPQGRIQAELECYALEESFFVLGHKMARERTIEHLDKFIIMDDVTLTDETDRRGSFSIEGPKAIAIAKEMTGIDLEAPPEFSHAATNANGMQCRILRRSRTGLPGVEFIVAREHLATAWHGAIDAVKRHGSGPAGYEAVNMLRLEAGIPWYGADFDENQIPHQAALEGTHVSFSKGCYTGQEIVERVRSRGQLQRRRVRLRFPGTETPLTGEPLFAGEAEVGFVTSAAKSPAMGASAGMGYVRREQTEPGSKMTWKHGEAEVVEGSG